MICTHPDIAYSVGILSQHVACPGKTHMQAVKHNFRYLCRTSYYKLEFQSNDSTPSLLKAFLNSNWAGDWVDRKSISGFIIILDQGAVSWGSKKQTSISLSTVEAEFVAALTAVREILCITNGHLLICDWCFRILKGSKMQSLDSDKRCC